MNVFKKYPKTDEELKYCIEKNEELIKLLEEREEEFGSAILSYLRLNLANLKSIQRYRKSYEYII